MQFNLPALASASALLVGTLVACDSTVSAPGDDAESPLFSQHADRQVPYTAEFDDLASRVAPGPECPVLTVYIEGSGRSSHLGRTHVRQHHCINPWGPNPLAFTDGEFEATAANGDMVSGTYSGTSIPTSDPTVLEWVGTWQFTAGTGRFHGVSGSGTGSGVNNLATGTGISQLRGSISAPRRP
jgi:hypothetical protein